MKTRILHTQFWEDEYIVSLETEGKIIFNFLVTNKRVSVAGIYEMPDVEIALYTGCQVAVVQKYMAKFIADRKITKFKNWIRLVNFDSYNSYNGNDLQVAKENIRNIAPVELFSDLGETSVETSPDSPIYNILNNNINNNNINRGVETSVQTSVNTSVETSVRASKVKRFQKPTQQEIEAYCLERKNTVDPQKFFDYYESNGWKVGKNAMKDWKAAVRSWENNGYSSGIKSNGAVKAEKNKYRGK